MAKIDILLEGSGIGTDQGVVAFCSIFLVRAGDRNIVFDSGHVGRRTALERALQERGLATADIDLLVMSHAHWDHVQNVDLFENASLLIHPDERKYSHKPHRNDWATPGWTGAAIETVERIEETGDGQQIAPGVSIMDLPGHSPGSIGLLVEEDDGGRGVLTGDALHYAGVALTRECPLVFWNDEQATASINRVVDTADVIYPGHDQAFRVKDGEIEYVSQFKLGLIGLSADGATLRPGARLLSPADIKPGWRVMPGIEHQSLA